MAKNFKTVLQQLIAANTAAIALVAGLDVVVSAAATPPASTTSPTVPTTPATPDAVKWDRYAIKNLVVPVGSAGTTVPAPAAGLKLVLSDEFDGASLDTKKWFLGGKPSSDGAQWGGAHFVGATEPGSADIYKVANGALTITARYDANYQDPEGWGRKWRSGHLSAAFPGGAVSGAARKGYFEARMKMPKNPGAWSAFWLLNVASIDQTKKPVTVEEDIVEAYGHDMHAYMFVQHDWQGPSKGTNDTGLRVTGLPDLSADFHTYGAQITDTEIVVYFDGVEKGRKPLAEAAVVDPFFVMLDLAISQDWPVTVPASGRIDLVIDYVRVWSAD